jgi:hypothetical protein
MNREDQRLAKHAAWRASRGLAPRQDARGACRKRASQVHKQATARFTETYEDRLDDIGLSLDY